MEGNIMNSLLQYESRTVFRSWLRISGSSAWLNGYGWFSGNWNMEKRVFAVFLTCALP
jgi:hypothetical protein